MLTQKNRIALTVVVLLGIAALVTGLFVSQHMLGNKRLDPAQIHGTLLSQPREIADFALTGTDGKPFNNHSLEGQWTLIFFGFSNCGYLCPTTMAELAKTERLLETDGVTPLPKVVMISIDPERDTLDKLKQYTAAFHPSFTGARGDESVVKQMTHEMGVAYVKVNARATDNQENYDIQHSGAVMLFNPKGQLTAFFTTPHQADLLAKDYQLLVSH